MSLNLARLYTKLEQGHEMKITEYIKKGFQIAFLRREVIQELTKDKNATFPAILMIILSSILYTIIDTILFHQSIFVILYNIVFTSIIGTILFYGGTNFIARIMKSKEKFIFFFRASGLSYVTGVFVIPLIICF